MPHLKKEAPPEVLENVRIVEERADKCWRALEIIRNPCNVAVWGAAHRCHREGRTLAGGARQQFAAFRRDAREPQSPSCHRIEMGAQTWPTCHRRLQRRKSDTRIGDRTTHNSGALLRRGIPKPPPTRRGS